MGYGLSVLTSVEAGRKAAVTRTTRRWVLGSVYFAVVPFAARKATLALLSWKTWLFLGLMEGAGVMIFVTTAL